nr:hypothetical protein [Actinomadura glauciflava]
MPRLAAQFDQLFLLVGAQAVEVAFFDFDLADPVTQARMADAQTLGQRGDLLVADHTQSNEDVTLHTKA